jgi:hypothetical protein
MFDLELQRLEGVWTGTEKVSDGVNDYSSSGRLVFQTVFDGRFPLCDYVQTAQQANAVAEGDKPIFYETVDACTTRTTSVVLRDRLSVCTDRAHGDDWKRIFEGTYRRR